MRKRYAFKDLAGAERERAQAPLAPDDRHIERVMELQGVKGGCRSAIPDYQKSGLSALGKPIHSSL